MKTYAPGKMILSGEHAVVYGNPAVAVAIKRYVTAKVTAQGVAHYLLSLPTLGYRQQLSRNQLQHIQRQLQQRYHQFKHGQLPIQAVLQHPAALAQFALSLLVERLPEAKGLKLEVQSTIPRGAGMGSSAALILAILTASAQAAELPLSTAELLQLALATENLQHGQSSGVDLRVSQQGGGVWVKEGMVTVQAMPILPWYVVNTGWPQASTGECVAHAAKYFCDRGLLTAFAEVTTALARALTANARTEIAQCLQQNQQLLMRIGVVPARVQHFMQALAAKGGVAKISGAGSVRGEQGGSVLVLMEDVVLLRQLCQQYHYAFFPLEIAARGVHVI